MVCTTIVRSYNKAIVEALSCTDNGTLITFVGDMHHTSIPTAKQKVDTFSSQYEEITIVASELSDNYDIVSHTNHNDRWYLHSSNNITSSFKELASCLEIILSFFVICSLDFNCNIILAFSNIMGVLNWLQGYLVFAIPFIILLWET